MFEMDILEQLRKKLDAKSIHSLRQLGRAVGVYSPTNKKKEELIDGIIAIAKNETVPAPRSARGAPPKSTEYDIRLLDDIERCRRYFAGLTSPEPEAEGTLTARSREDDGEEQTYAGILEYSNKVWTVHTQTMQTSDDGDVVVGEAFVNRYNLKRGDEIVCRAIVRIDGNLPEVTYIISVNGNSPDKMRCKGFDYLTPCYPDKRMTLEYDGCSLTERMIDLFAPIGYGQRALIVAPHGAGNTTLIKCIAGAILRNHPAVHVIILLIDERPEEVTDMRRTLRGAEVAASTFECDERHHAQTANLVLEHAKRLVETGEDVVVLMDSITRLARAYNAVSSSDRARAGELDPQAMVEPKRLFGAARNVEGGGSLTVIATALADTGRKFDDAVYAEIKTACNMEIVLSRTLAESALFPAIDVKHSGARKPELLLSEKERATVASVRAALGNGLTAKTLLDGLANTPNNAQFLEECKKYQKFNVS